MPVIIGVDPHKATHTAVALSSDEQELAHRKVRSGGHQAEHLLAWAEPFEGRTWAIESAGGLGYLLAQQLVAAGETVLDVPATLASRVRVLATGRSNKNLGRSSAAAGVPNSPVAQRVYQEVYRQVYRASPARRRLWYTGPRNLEGPSQRR